MKENKNDVNLIIVIIGIIFIIAISGLMILLAYRTNISAKKIDINSLDIVEDNDYFTISSIKEDGNYLKIEGYITKEFKRYQLYFGVKNKNDEITFYPTKWHGVDNSVVSVIPKDVIKENSDIYIGYMCDDEKLLISTNRNVGEAYEK